MLRKTSSAEVSLGSHASFTGRMGSNTSMGRLGSVASGSLSTQASCSSETWPDVSASFSRRQQQRPSYQEGFAKWAWVAIAATLLTSLFTGVALMCANQYGHIHDHIDKEYNAYVEAWQTGELTEFYNTKWTLIVDDQHIVNLQREADSTKVVQTVLGTHLKRNMTTHVSFSISSLIPYVFYPTPEDPPEGPAARDPKSWKRVQQSMYNHQNFRLKGVHQSSGATSWITLDDYPFVRRTSGNAHGLSNHQCRERGGLHEADGTCLQLEYLEEVCIRVSLDSQSPDPHYYDTDSTHQGAGCYPEDGLIVPQYRHLALGHLNGAPAAPPTIFLPRGAENSTRMIVRHAHDPELMEKVLKHELSKELGHKQRTWTIGAFMALVSMLLLAPALRRASPTAVRASRQLYLRYKFPNSMKKEDGPGDAVDCRAFCNV